VSAANPRKTETATKEPRRGDRKRMSEIFSYLKKAEVQRRKEISETTVEPVLDVSPQIETPDVKAREDARFDLAAADQRIKSVLDPLTVVGEQYRLLRAKLSLLQRDQGIKSLLVTSSLPDEGKTFTACCLAGVFAQEPGRRVLLIDGDLRKPKAGRSLGMVGSLHSPGLAQVLRGEAVAQDTLLSSGALDFFLLPAGAVPPDPAELLSSPLLEQTIKSMRDYFDWVVIDSPPVLALADATLMAPLCDAILLIVRTDRTATKYIKEAINRLGPEKMCGVVLNRGRHLQTTKYYYRYYHQDLRSRRKG